MWFKIDINLELNFNKKNDMYWNEVDKLIKSKNILGLKEYIRNHSPWWWQWIADWFYNIWNYVWQYFNEHKLAIKLYKESIRYGFNDSAVYNNTATEYKRLSNFEGALKYYKLALEYDFNNPLRYLRIAMLYAFIKDEDNAIKFMKDFLNIWWDEILLISTCRHTKEWGDELLKLYNLI